MTSTCISSQLRRLSGMQATPRLGNLRDLTQPTTWLARCINKGLQAILIGTLAACAAAAVIALVACGGFAIVIGIVFFIECILLIAFLNDEIDAVIDKISPEKKEGRSSGGGGGNTGGGDMGSASAMGGSGAATAGGPGSRRDRRS